jgi:hypothetical protein
MSFNEFELPARPPATAFFCRCLSLGRFTERRFLAETSLPSRTASAVNSIFLCLAVHHDAYYDLAAG